MCFGLGAGRGGGGGSRGGALAIHARVHLPEANNGYYRDTRLDWPGVIARLAYKGHSYFGQWFPRTTRSFTIPSRAGGGISYGRFGIELRGSEAG
jgi:hypothetical protein